MKLMTKLAAIGTTAALTLGVGATAASASTTSASTDCAPDTWPAATAGRPHRTAGVDVWQDGNGWHVRVRHRTLHDRVFSGRIVTKGEFVDVHAIRLEKNDHVKVGPNKHGIVFRFNNYGGVDGFDFNTQCAPALKFGFLSNGHRIPPKRISVGHRAHHPRHDPFVIRRTA